MTPRYRWLALFVLLYLAWDFADPAVPGVFVFNADQCFDATSEKRLPPEFKPVALPTLMPQGGRLAATPVVTAASVLSYGPERSVCFTGLTLRLPAQEPDSPRSPEDH